jgi:hypothetical protein
MYKVKDIIGTAGTQATAMRQAITGTPTAAEMQETVLSPTPFEFSQKFAKKWAERGKFVEYKEKEWKSPFFDR